MRRIIPAYAGSTRPDRPASLVEADHPRIRGEHPTIRGLGERKIGSSPHTRGAPSPGCSRRPSSRIIPAYAGSTNFLGAPDSVASDHPRIRGEHSMGSLFTGYGGGSSPHTRGARKKPNPSQPARGDHPRIRGEHGRPPPSTAERSGSSPHTRGAPHRGFSRACEGGIIPAYAGSTRRRPAKSAATPDHPRIRGEHDCSIYFTNFPTGSSPHTRGALSRAWPRRRPSGIIPAYAGSTSSRKMTQASRAGSSPHTRGARPCRSRPSGAAGIIPAYAGSTSWRASRCAWRGDHPRIRGEHGVDLALHPGQAGSSPHTRGAPERGVRLIGPNWIIPAYAGSTDENFLAAAGGEGSSPHTRGAPWPPTGSTS